MFSAWGVGIPRVVPRRPALFRVTQCQPTWSASHPLHPWWHDDVDGDDDDYYCHDDGDGDDGDALIARETFRRTGPQMGPS